MTLRYDTYVINHGYVGGYADAIPEILQAGQAVLVIRMASRGPAATAGTP